VIRFRENHRVEGASPPNDHVNWANPVNDVIPTAIHVAVGESIPTPDARFWNIWQGLRSQNARVLDIIKIGRTHLMDRHPIRLGQEFQRLCQTSGTRKLRAGNAIAAVEELALVNGGRDRLNCHPEFPGRVMGTSGTDRSRLSRSSQPF